MGTGLSGYGIEWVQHRDGLGTGKSGYEMEWEQDEVSMGWSGYRFKWV